MDLEFDREEGKRQELQAYKFTNDPGKVGMVPLNRLLDNVKLVKDPRLEIEEGIEPVTPFPPIANLVKKIKFPIEFGKGPRTLLLVRSSLNTERLVSQVTPNHPFLHGSANSQF